MSVSCHVSPSALLNLVGQMTRTVVTFISSCDKLNYFDRTRRKVKDICRRIFHVIDGTHTHARESPGRDLHPVQSLCFRLRYVASFTGLVSWESVRGVGLTDFTD